MKYKMKKIITLMIFIAFELGLCLTCVYGQDIGSAIGKLSQKETRQEGIKEIESIGTEALPMLKEIAQDKNKSQEERITAIILIGKIGTKAETQAKSPMLSKSLTGSTEEKSMTSIVEERQSLEKILLTDEDKFLRESSAIGLGYLGDKEAIPTLKEAMNDESGNVRMRAVWALAKLGDNSGKDLALETIKGKDVTAQLLAVEGLEAIGDKSVISELAKNVDSPDATVWTKIHSKLAIKRLEVQGLSDNERINYLKETLKDEQFEINNWAARELGKEIKEESKERNNALRILKETAKDESNEGSYSAGKVLMILLKEGKITEDELK